MNLKIKRRRAPNKTLMEAKTCRPQGFKAGQSKNAETYSKTVRGAFFGWPNEEAQEHACLQPIRVLLGTRILPLQRQPRLSGGFLRPLFKP